MEIGDNGGWVPQGECYNLVDSDCTDPVFASFTPTYDYSTPSALLGEPTAMTGEGADDFGESICEDLAERVEASLASDGSCTTDGDDSDACKAAINTILCNTDEYVASELRERT